MEIIQEEEPDIGQIIEEGGRKEALTPDILITALQKNNIHPVHDSIDRFDRNTMQAVIQETSLCPELGAKLLDELIKHYDIDLKAYAQSHDVPLMKSAIWFGKVEHVRTLVENDSPLLHRSHGSLPLHAAARQTSTTGSNFDILEELVKHYDDVDIRQNDGYTPLSLAVKYALVRQRDASDQWTADNSSQQEMPPSVSHQLTKAALLLGNGANPGLTISNDMNEEYTVRDKIKEGKRQAVVYNLTPMDDHDFGLDITSWEKLQRMVS